MKSKYGFIVILLMLVLAFSNSNYLHAQQTLAANAPVTVNINNGQRVQLSFTAPSVGEYVIESTNNGSLDPVAFSAASGTASANIINDDGGEGRNFRFSRSLRAGEVFTFFAGVHRDSGNGSYTVNVQSMQSVSLSANAPAAVNISNGQRVQVNFTAPAAGEYRFASANNGSLDPVAYSSVSGTGSAATINDDGGEGRNFRFTRNLRAGEVFTFFAGVHRDSGNGSYTVNVQGLSAAQSAVPSPGIAVLPQTQTITTEQPIDAEWQLVLDRVNLLVDNHFENRDFSAGQNANWNLTGLSVGIYKNGRTAFFNRGFHESQQRRVANRRPVTENSIFLLGSISKAVSNIMLSYFSRINNPATGRPYVNLNDPLNNYFRTPPFIDTDGTRIHPTLLQFATHYAGAPRAIGTGSPTLTQFRSQLENLTYVHKPGTAYQYSSGATVTANVVASLYYGRDFPNRRVDHLLQEKLFGPLGMNSSSMNVAWNAPVMQDRVTLPHSFNGDPMQFYPVPSYIHLGGASGGITSTAVDMMRLAAFILGDYVPAGTEVLQQAAAAYIGWNHRSIEGITRVVPSTALSVHESNFESMGVRFREMFGRPSNAGQRYGNSFEHGGGIRGHVAYMIICPDTKTAVVVLLNNYAYSMVTALSAQIMDRVLNATYPAVAMRNPFDDQIASYARANANMEIVLNQDFTIELPVNHIRAPARAGATLTIRSANSARPVTLTRGVTGDLFTVPNGATLIFRDIIIDGGGNINFGNEENNMDEYDEDGNLLTRSETAVAGSLVRENAGGTFIMESGAVLRNNINSGTGGGVAVTGNSAVFTMSGGRISGNTTATSGGGISLWNNARFTMSGGEISGNTAGTNGGGLGVSGSGTVFNMSGGRISDNIAGTNGGGLIQWGGAQFTMSGGEIINNTNTSNNAGSGIRVTGTGSVFNLSGGVVAGTGRNIAAVVSGTYHLNTASPNNAVIIAWNRPAGNIPNYVAGANTNLIVSAGATATWASQGGVMGVSYTNGTNRGWIRLW